MGTVTAARSNRTGSPHGLQTGSIGVRHDLVSQATSISIDHTYCLAAGDRRDRNGWLAKRGPRSPRSGRGSAAATRSAAAASAGLRHSRRTCGSTTDRDGGEQLDRVGVPVGADGHRAGLTHRAVDLEFIATLAASKVVSRHAARVAESVGNSLIRAGCERRLNRRLRPVFA